VEVSDGKRSTRNRKVMKKSDKRGRVTKGKKNLWFLWKLQNEEEEPSSPWDKIFISFPL
jgi:hypothetical protein